jgi:hypothetical protein
VPIVAIPRDDCGRSVLGSLDGSAKELKTSALQSNKTHETEGQTYYDPNLVPNTLVLSQYRDQFNS